MSNALPRVAGGLKRADALRVMLVDDSAVIRGLISRWIEAEPDMVVAASLPDGRDAVDQIGKIRPDVAVLDIEMPDLDGISALPKLLARQRDLVVIMASTLTRRNAEISLRALSLGAADYIPKPETSRDANAADTFRRDLIGKVRDLGARARRMRSADRAAPAQIRGDFGSPPHPASVVKHAPITLRAFSAAMPKVLLIGASTGGPQALMALAAELATVVARAPVLITQHMPPTFTTILAEHLSRSGRVACHEGVDGERVQPGRVYLAPGGRHMRVVRRGVDIAIALDDGPAVNFCKPAVDPLFSSAAAIWRAGTLAVVLTGMGADGARGGRDVVAAGGSVIAQDEATSVVWGMPGAAAHAGICSAVLPLKQIAPRIVRLFAGDRI